MPAKVKYKSLKGDITIITETGSSLTYHLEGMQASGKDLDDMPDYIAELAKQVMTGVEDKDFKVLEAKVERLEEGNKKLKGDLENAKKRLAQK